MRILGFYKDKIDTNMAMFILIEDTFVTLGIFDNSELLYAKHLDMEHDKDSDELLMEDHDSDDIELDLAIENEMDLDELSTDELDNLAIMKTHFKKEDIFRNIILINKAENLLQTVNVNKGLLVENLLLNIFLKSGT